jgi:hypothetical protein
VQHLLSEVDIRHLVALGTGAVVVARIVAQIDVVGHGLGKGEHGEHADKPGSSGHQ